MTKHRILGGTVAVDVQALVESRLLIQANSGGGKSFAIRKLLEISYGACQHIVIDVEGEFHTLREKYDYVLAGKGGECAADIKSAALLARRLLELNVSCIIDIYELGTQRQLFVRRFLESLVDAPRSLWHPAIIIVDEAQKFCPETAKAESAAAVENLMTLGRKRGFCGVLATQRISDLSKSAAAECNNKLIGRCGLDVDQKRAGKEIGFTKAEDILGLRDLRPGEFYAFGPAFSVQGVSKFQIGAVETTHPKAGQRSGAPTPPRDKVKKILGQLDDLPHEAEEEARTSAELREQVKQLRRQLAAKPGAVIEVTEKPVPLIDKGMLGALLRGLNQVDTQTQNLDKVRDKLAQAQQVVVAEAGNLLTFAKRQLALTVPPPPQSRVAGRLVLNGVGHSIRGSEANITPKNTTGRVHRRMGDAGVEVVPINDDGSDGLMPAKQKIIDTLALLAQLDIVASRETLAAWFGQHPNSKSYTNNLGALRSAGLIEGLALTDAGRAEARQIRIPTQDDLRELILRPLKPAQRRIVDILLHAGRGLSREELAGELGMHPNTKAVTNNIGALRTRQLVTKGWPIEAGRVLYMEGAS